MDPSGISKEDNMWYLKTKQYFTLQTWIFPTNGDVSQKEWEGLPPVNVGVSSKFLGHMDFWELLVLSFKHVPSFYPEKSDDDP